MKKPLLFVLARIVPIAIGIGIAFNSCKNTSGDVEPPPQVVYAPPVVQPLKLGKAIKINWDSIKAVPVHPLVRPFDLDKLPAQSYDTAGFKPFKYPVEEAKLDINALPEKDLDIDKLPSRPLKFTMEKLPPPQLIRTGLPHLKDANKFLYELTEAQGMRGIITTCLFTDRDGFLWIGTDKGLFRYDGDNLLFYLPVVQPHYIFSMLQDNAGRIWLTTINSGGDVEVLDVRNSTLKKTNKSLGLSGDLFGRILRDGEQRIWVTVNSSKGLSIIDPETQTVKWLDKAHNLSDTITNCIKQDNDHNIWITTNKGVNIIDLKNKKIKYLTRSNGLKSDTVDELFFDRAGKAWLGLQDGILNVIDFHKNSIEAIKEVQRPKTTIITFLEDKQGKIWVATILNGLEIIDPAKRTAINIKKSDGLAGDIVINVNEDSQGQVWVATTSGLNMFSINSTVTEHIGKLRVSFLQEDSQGLVWNEVDAGVDVVDRVTKTARRLDSRDGLSNDTLGQMVEMNDKILLPNASGLDIIDRPGKTIAHLGKAQGITGRLTQTIAVDKTGRIWASEPGGLCVYDPKNGTIKHLSKTQGFKDGTVDNIQVDAKGRIWYNKSSGRLGFIDPKTYVIKNIDNNAQGFKEAGGGIIFPDNKGNMWIGTAKGIYIVDPDNGTFTAFSTAQGLIDERVATLLQRGGQIYASTVKGLTIITPPAEGIVVNKKWGVRSFGNEYGLNKVNANYGLTDAMSRNGDFLWGDYGFNVLDLSKKDTLIPPSYITGIDIMDQPKYFTGSGAMASQGMTWDQVNSQSNLPENLQLRHDQNYMQFNFATLNFTAHDTTWYRYKLIGKDTAWSEKNPLDHSRNYFNLASGKYTFEVVSKSFGNGWSKPAVFSFAITPPWWLTWWAYILYTVLFACIIWGFAHFRSLKLVEEKRVLEQKVHLRTEEVLQQKEEIEAQRDDLEKAFKELKTTQTQLIQSEKMASLGELTAGIAHEIQNPLNFVNNFSEVSIELAREMEEELDKGDIKEAKAISADLVQNLEKINHHGKRADFIVKGMLQHSRTGSGERQLTNINVLAGEFFKLSFQGLRAKNKSFNAEMVTSFDKTIPEINIVQQDIGRVLLNLFNNAFYAVNQKGKTANKDYKPEVTVTTAKENGQVIITVKDNGIGIPDAIKEKIMQPFFTTKPTGEGTGLGLSLTYDMVVKGHGGSINVNSTEGKGSEFIISLPV